ncbi:MAG: hypothetical protein ABIA59_01875, partial [Candidatus Latescibacterota bacterium]
MKTVFYIALAVLALLPATVICGTVTITVHDYAAGDGPTDLASGGIPLRQGALLNPGFITLQDGAAYVPIAVKVLARWQ